MNILKKIKEILFPVLPKMPPDDEELKQRRKELADKIIKNVSMRDDC